jgi:hypothetical protein
MEGSGNGGIAVHTGIKIEEASRAEHPLESLQVERPLESLEVERPLLESLEVDDEQHIAKKAKVDSEEDNVDLSNNAQGGSPSMTNLSALPGLHDVYGKLALRMISFFLVSSLVSFAL